MDEELLRNHHRKLDDLLKDFGNYCHERMQAAVRCGAIEQDCPWIAPDSFAFAKSIITIAGKSGVYKNDLNDNWIEFTRNLRYFV